MIGIDVVDIQDSGEPGWQHIRHLQRVASAEEQAWVKSRLRPDLALCVLWAAKEAAYKALSCPDRDEPFIPSGVAVCWQPDQLTGLCRWRGRQASVLARMDGYHAEALAVSEWANLHTLGCLYEVSRISGGSFPTPAQESLAARQLAASLLQRAGHPGGVIKRAVNGKPCLSGFPEVSLSLSHHGRWIAAAIALPREGNRQV